MCVSWTSMCSSWTAFTATTTSRMPTTTNGVRTVSAWVRDANGNTSPAGTDTIGLDMTKPTNAAGPPLLVTLEGLITSRPSGEFGRGSERTVVVERFVGVHPGKGCPPVPRSPAAAAPAMGRPR
jgi:hypothetical protein